MGLFSFGGNKKPEKSGVVGWLNEVDQAYSRAYQVKNVTGLANYLTRTCLSKQMELVRLGEKEYSGLARYKHVDWVKGSLTNEGLVYLKKVTYDHVKMAHGISAAVGDDYTEEWILIKENGVQKVASIRRVA